MAPGIHFDRRVYIIIASSTSRIFFTIIERMECNDNRQNALVTIRGLLKNYGGGSQLRLLQKLAGWNLDWLNTTSPPPPGGGEGGKIRLENLQKKFLIKISKTKENTIIQLTV